MVAIFSGALVMLQLSGPPAASATTAAAPIAATAPRAAKTWDLEPRWWSGNAQHVESGSKQHLERLAPTAPSTGRTVLAESDLTFAKGYALRLAARRAAAAEQVAATVPSAEGKTGTQIARSTPVAHHANATPGRSGADPPQIEAGRRYERRARPIRRQQPDARLRRTASGPRRLPATWPLFKNLRHPALTRHIPLALICFAQRPCANAPSPSAA